MGSPIPDATTRRAAPQCLRVAEPLAVFALIMLYIWWLRPIVPYTWAPMLALVLASHCLRGEGAGALGFGLANFRACAREVTPALVFIALLLYISGALFQTARPIGFDRALLVLLAYIPWGLFQQYLLNGYFVNRFSAALPERYVPVVSAALFSAAHLPNPFLMVVTLLAGHACARLYLKHRNLYYLGLAHAAIGFLLYFTIPNSIIRNLNVGPAWFRWK